MEHLKSPHKPTVVGAIFGRFFGCSGESVRINFGVNGQDVTMFLSSKALKQFYGAFK